MMRNESELLAFLEKLATWKEDHGRRSAWPGMTYEDGIEATLDWILGETNSDPLTED